MDLGNVRFAPSLQGGHTTSVWYTAAYTISTAKAEMCVLISQTACLVGAQSLKA